MTEEDEMIAAMLAMGNCPKHDLPMGREGKCSECHWQDAAARENERDTQHLWNQR